MKTSLVEDGITISDRFNKAIETVKAKHCGILSDANAEIEGLTEYKFGLSKAEYEEMVGTGKFAALAIQKNRHEHQRAQTRIAKQQASERAKKSIKSLDIEIVEAGF